MIAIYKGIERKSVNYFLILNLRVPVFNLKLIIYNSLNNVILYDNLKF